MHWALWVNDANRAVKLHLKFSVLRQGAAEALVTADNRCERKTLRQMLTPGEIIALLGLETKGKQGLAGKRRPRLARLCRALRSRSTGLRPGWSGTAH